MPDLRHFQNIMPIENIPSILRFGILSHEEASKHHHTSVALEDVQNKRAAKTVPGGLNLHQYANIYFHARNPMMSTRRGEAKNLCVLVINKKILELESVVITDQNAASDYVRFLATNQLNVLDLDYIYAEDWRHDNKIDYFRHSSAKCAEVLIPYKLPPSWILGAYVVDSATEDKLRKIGFTLPIKINSSLFFH